MQYRCVVEVCLVQTVTMLNFIWTITLAASIRILVIIVSFPSQRRRPSCLVSAPFPTLPFLGRRTLLIVCTTWTGTCHDASIDPQAHTLCSEPISHLLDT